MNTAALALALSLLASNAVPAVTPSPDAEPLPAGAPTQEYPLTAWCFGALSEYLEIYDRVKPDLVAIDKLWGSSVKNEASPYAADMAAAHEELKVIAEAVEAAEKASPSPIAPEGVAYIQKGRSIWRPAESKTERELARAWLTWALPDQCNITARELSAKSALLGKALNYNSDAATPAPANTQDAAPGAPAAPVTPPGPPPGV
jgi:hypothetical protein